MAVKKPTSKTPAKSRTGSSKSKLNSLPKVNKWLALLFVAVIAGVGAYIIFRANAATNNCQAVGAVQICDVDMALGNDTTVLSTTGWADSLGKAGFWYFGAVFRAPTTAYAGSVPISAVYTESATYRDYMTVAQKSLKDSAFPGKTKNEGVAFYAWENPGQPDTVPVYRITQGGSTTKTFYSTDLGTINRLLAEGQNDPNGWKRDQFAGSSFIAFYAYPPNYAVAKQPNPYDCSIQANFISDRCTGSRAALETAIAAGNVPVGKDCPATLEIYRKAPFASQFDQACQDKWNSYMNDCTVKENFLSDRCKVERQAFVDAEAEQARQRAAAAAAQRRVPSKPGKPGTSSTASTSSTTGGCTLGVETCTFLAECSTNGCPNFNQPTPTPTSPRAGLGTCTITYDSRYKLLWVGFGPWRPEKQVIKNIYYADCMSRELGLSFNTAKNIKRKWTQNPKVVPRGRVPQNLPAR
ncbi:MAG: hypothetical protein NT114_00155 [Patescibacteria group bacterium]|nr:hypothetical protein [Patescibacteria group bacterium]